MTGVAWGLAGIAFIVAVAWVWHTRIAPANPQATAFGTTFAAALFIITGSIGFGLQKGPALFSEARWSDGVIWPQVGLGIAFSIAAVFAWRIAIKDANRRLARG